MQLLITAPKVLRFICGGCRVKTRTVKEGRVGLGCVSNGCNGVGRSTERLSLLVVKKAQQVLLQEMTELSAVAKNNVRC